VALSGKGQAQGKTVECLSVPGDTTATPRGPGISSADDGLGSVLDRPCSLSGVQAGVYAWLFVLALVYLLLAVYLDNVVPDANGVRKPLFLSPVPVLLGGQRPRTAPGTSVAANARVSTHCPLL